jgi:hypothetical protein
MKFATALWAFGTFLTLFSSGAAQDFQPVSPDELRMTTEPLAPIAPAIILERRVDRDDNGGFAHAYQTNYFRIKVLTEEGRKYADVEIPYHAGSSTVLNIHARSIAPDGTIADFDGKTYERYGDQLRGGRPPAVIFTLPNVQVGSILEYSFTLDLRGNYFDSHWVLNSELFTRRARFSLRPFRGNYTPMSMRWTWKELPLGVEPKEGPDHVIRMEVNNIPAYVAEDFTPPENELKSRVDFIYQDGPAQTDPDKFWKQTGRLWSEGLEYFLRKHKAVSEAARRMVVPDDPPEKRLRAIYGRVQAMRNTSYEPDRTTAEDRRDKEKPPATVDDVWNHGYGNSVQLTWLFLALARAAGFEAYGCWVASRSEYFFNPKLMDSSGLNANVVLVKLKEGDLYLDPGTAFAPFGLLPWNETSTPGLRLDKDGGTWIRTPLPDSADTQIVRSASFKISGDGTLEGKLTLTLTGLEAMYDRLAVRNSDPVGRKQFLEELVKTQVPVGTEVDLTGPPDWNNVDEPLQSEFALTIPGWASPTGRRLLLPVGIFGRSEKGMFQSAERIHPVYFAYPYRQRDDVTIELPSHGRVMTVPEPHTYQGNGVAYTMSAASSSGRLQIKRQLDVAVFLLDLSEYPGLRRFFQMVRSADEEQFVLDPSGAGPGVQ